MVVVVAELFEYGFPSLHQPLHTAEPAQPSAVVAIVVVACSRVVLSSLQSIPVA